MKQSVTVGAQLLWGGHYGCNNGRYGCTIVMSYIEINKAVSQWLLTFNLCVSVTWPLTCAFHIPCTHTPEIIDMHRGVCDNSMSYLQQQFSYAVVVNSLVPGKLEWNFIYVIFKRILVTDGWGITYEITLIWMSLNFTEDQSTLVQVMAWCLQATGHYLS